MLQFTPGEAGFAGGAAHSCLHLREPEAGFPQVGPRSAVDRAVDAAATQHALVGCDRTDMPVSRNVADCVDSDDQPHSHVLCSHLRIAQHPMHACSWLTNGSSVSIEVSRYYSTPDICLLFYSCVPWRLGLLACSSTDRGGSWVISCSNLKLCIDLDRRSKKQA